MTAKRTRFLVLLAALAAFALTSCATTYRPPANPGAAELKQDAAARKEEKIDREVGEMGGTNRETEAIEEERLLPPGVTW